MEPPPPPAEALVRLLQEGLEELAAPPELARPCAVLCELLASWAARMNLTGHRNPDAIARRLVLDALALAEALPVAPPASLADLGSGAGFPGLPLAIRWPACRVTLLEARERRHHFQRAAIRALGLARVAPVRARIERAAPDPHALVIAQAFAAPDRAAASMAPWVEPGGWLVLPLSAGSRPPAPPVGFEPPIPVGYRVPLGGPERRAWIARRGAGGRPAEPCDT